MKLQQGEQILHELRPEASVVVPWFFSKCVPAAFSALFFIMFLLPIIVLMFISTESGLTTFEMMGKLALGAAPTVLILNVIYMPFLRKTYRYYVTNKRCVFEGGILRRVERSVPFHKITDVEISANVLDRQLKISTLKIFTPGSMKMRGWPIMTEQAEIEFVGLKDSETPAATVNSILSTYRATGE